MANKIITHEELQRIEHANKVLEEHLELVTKVVNETEGMLNNYVPILSAYVHSVIEVQKSYTESVAGIIRSTRELGIITGKTPDVLAFIGAIRKLDEILTPELVEKFRRLTSDAH